MSDEAGDTPGWVPALGLTLFAVLALLFAVQYALEDAQPAAAGAPDGAELQAAGPAAPEKQPVAPVAPGDDH